MIVRPALVGGDVPSRSHLRELGVPVEAVLLGLANRQIGENDASPPVRFCPETLDLVTAQLDRRPLG